MPSFAVSIVFLTLMQAAVVAVPGAPPRGLLDRVRSRWWALVPPASIIVVIALVGLYASSANALSYLALVAVPPLAAIALGAVMRGARPPLALAAVPLFALAWAVTGSLVGETAALALSALACVTLGVFLAAVVAPRWLRLGVYAMAVVDTVLVVADLLQGPNSTLVAAGPSAGLPARRPWASGICSSPRPSGRCWRATGGPRSRRPCSPRSSASGSTSCSSPSIYCRPRCRSR